MTGILPQHLVSKLNRLLESYDPRLTRVDDFRETRRGIARPLHGDNEYCDTDSRPGSHAPLRIAGLGDGALRAIALLAVDSEIEATRLRGSSELLDMVQRGLGYDLVLLDWQGGDGANLALIRDLKALSDDALVVIVNGGGNLSRLQQVVDNLGRGQKDHDELDATRGVVEWGNLVLDPRCNQVTWKGEMVPLTIAEFNIVRLFAARIGEAICYREIYDVVHRPGFHAGDGEAGYHTNVRSLVKRIRKKFLAVDPGFVEIQNHRAFGYRWRLPQKAAASEAFRERNITYRCS